LIFLPHSKLPLEIANPTLSPREREGELLLQVINTKTISSALQNTAAFHYVPEKKGVSDE
jgi:hypothetical protein